MNENQINNFPQLAARWRELWDAMMTQYCPGRESAFNLALDLLDFTLRDTPLRILDVGCGSGAFVERVLERLPLATVTALDHDNAALCIARTMLGGERVRWVRGEVWESWEPLGLGEFDAVFMGWLTHELAPWQLAALYSNVYTLLRPTGLLLNADFMPDLAPGFRELAQDMTLRRLTDDFSIYEHNVESNPVWIKAMKEHWNVFRDLPSSPISRTRWRVYHPATEHHLVLLDAGFREHETVWRYMESGMILAVR